MAVDAYPFGQPVRLVATFVDGDGNPTDPSTVELRVQPQWVGDVQVFTGTDLVDDPGVGSFSHIFMPDRSGDWTWEWCVTDPFKAASNGVFHVRQRPASRVMTPYPDSVELPASVDLVAYHGDTWTQTFKLTNDTGVPHDLTNATIACWARNNGTVIQLIVETSGEPGVVTVSLPVPASQFAVDRYRYDLEVTEADTTVKTWIRGTLDIIQGVTND